MHQRSCKVIPGLNNELLEDLRNQEENENNAMENLYHGLIHTNITNDDEHEYPQLNKA